MQSVSRYHLFPVLHSKEHLPDQEHPDPGNILPCLHRFPDSDTARPLTVPVLSQVSVKTLSFQFCEPVNILQGFFHFRYPHTIPETSLPEPEVAPEPEVKQPMITQDDEPSIVVKKEKPKTEKKKTETKKPVKVEKPKQPVKPVEQPKEKTEAEKRAEAERAAAQAAANKIAGAFGKGSQMGSKGNAGSGTGVQGSPDGNASEGKTSGVGGYGTFDLNGRSLGAGGLPVPVYNVQDEGRVVVTIVVNPAGQVISTSINKRTNTVNPTLRKAAEEAARKARFNKVDGVNNQSGTITYYFKLK